MPLAHRRGSWGGSCWVAEGPSDERPLRPHTQLEAGVGLIQRRSQYRLRPVGALHLPQVTHVLEPW
jgi:hypothetical protein